MLLVISLKDILLTYESKQGNGMVQDIIHLFFCFLERGYALLSIKTRVKQPHPIILAPFNPFFKFSSIKRDMYSGDLGFSLMNASNA
jgi:hypothetical protein